MLRHLTAVLKPRRVASDTRSLAASALLAILASVVPATRAHAQACLGLASLESRPTNLTVSALFSEGVKGLEGRFGFGSSIGFAGLSATLADYDDVDGTGVSIGADGGLSLVAGSRKNVTWCPVASLGYTRNPDVELLGESYGSNDVTGTAGIALGGRLTTSSSLALIPFASFQGAYSRFTVDLGGDDDSSTETYGLLSGGLSFVLNSNLLLRPVVTIPVGLDGSDPTFGFGVSFSFGRR